MEPLLGHIIEFLRAVGPGVVFLMTAVETAFFIGLVIPAEATVLVGAFFAAEGVFGLEDVVLATIFGGLTGDQIGYALGRFGGRRFAARGGRIGRLWAKHEPRATTMFGKHPIVAVTLARFVSFVRTLMPWFAGMTGMPYRRFLVFDALGVVGWGVASVAAGYLAGESWDVLAGALGTASTIIAGLLVALGILLFLRGRRAQRSGPTNRMYRVALTGNVASGKSVVAETWRAAGATLVDADELARRAVEPGSTGLRAVEAAFGADVIAADGTLDRASMRRIVFADPAQRQRLESILHPEIGRLRDEEDARLAQAGVPIVVHVVPLLFEVGLDGAFDLVVLVDSPEPLRVQRLIEMRGLDADEAGRLAAAQMPAASKRDRAGIVVDNTGTLEELQARAREVWNEIERRVAERT